MVSPTQSQYEQWPYPSVPWVASVPREHLWQLHVNWIRSRCALPPLSTQPKIWIAGCGTFEPYIFARANPESKILASDFSVRSLKIAQKRLRWHGAKNVELRQLDLTDPTQLPDDTFDLIECYGVLMCLPNPLETLTHLASKLNPDGVLRLMVYPHYSRQRIFQVQKLAKLLGLTFQNPRHPALLRNILKKLPKKNPLSYAFSSYWDAKNISGIVDGFLHASDRGFTGFELSALLDEAGLTPKFCFHRPWGQPDLMANKLSGLGEHNFSFWLHYLDLWQSLRTNFTLCVTKKGLASHPSFQTEKHPLFNLRNDDLGLAYKARLLRLGMTGTKLPSRTSENSLVLKPKEFKNVLLGKADKLTVGGELLIQSQTTPWDSSFNSQSKEVQPKKHFSVRQGDKILNPLFDYLFDAYTFKEQSKGYLPSSFPNLKQQIALWPDDSFPLENKRPPFGLTPFGTYHRFPKEITAYLETYLTAPEISFSELTLPNEFQCFKSTYSFLKSVGITELPENHNDEASLRQLWCLIFSGDKLFLS